MILCKQNFFVARVSKPEYVHLLLVMSKIGFNLSILFVEMNTKVVDDYNYILKNYNKFDAHRTIIITFVFKRIR